MEKMAAQPTNDLLDNLVNFLCASLSFDPLVSQSRDHQSHNEGSWNQHSCYISFKQLQADQASDNHRCASRTLTKDQFNTK